MRLLNKFRVELSYYLPSQYGVNKYKAFIKIKLLFATSISHREATRRHWPIHKWKKIIYPLVIIIIIIIIIIFILIG